MQDEVTINITVPKELLPVLASFVEGLKTSLHSPSIPDSNTGNEISSITTGIEVKPSREEVLRFCRSRNSCVDGNRFYNWAESHKWVDAKGNRITDWKSKIVEWEGYRLEKAAAPGAATSTTKNMLDASYDMMREWAMDE